jgi:hypothetical protein
MGADRQINRRTTQAKLRIATQVDFFAYANRLAGPQWRFPGRIGVMAIGSGRRKALQSGHLRGCGKEFHDLGNSPLAHPEKRC